MDRGSMELLKNFNSVWSRVSAAQGRSVSPAAEAKREVRKPAQGWNVRFAPLKKQHFQDK